MIPNKEWLATQTRRLSLEGFTQEEIAKELNISEGTVNAIIQELSDLDDSLQLQHEIALVSKKSGLSIKELASNLAFSNATKKLGFEHNKIDSILKAIDRICTMDGSLAPDSVANMTLSVFELILKKNISLDELYGEIGKKYDELERLKLEIDQTKLALAETQKEKTKALKEYDLTRRDLNKFTKLRQDFEEVGLDFENREEIQTVLMNMDELDNDARNIIDEVKKIRVFKLTEFELEQQCIDKEKNLKIYQKREDELKAAWNFNYPSIKILNTLLQNGVNPVTLHSVFDMLFKYEQFFSIHDLAKDIDTYGGIQAAIFKKKRELMSLTTQSDSLSSTQDFQYSGDYYAR